MLKVLFMLVLFSQSVFSFYDKAICEAYQGKVSTCSYSSTYLTAHELIQALRIVLRTHSIDVDDDNSYLRPGTGTHLVQFYHSDIASLDFMKSLIESMDRAHLPAKDRTELMVEINYYYLSDFRAEEKGFSLDFLFDGIVTPDLPGASYSPAGGLQANLGNLNNYWFGLNLNYAKNNGIVQLRETMKFKTYEGRALDFSETAYYYRDGPAGTDKEKAKKFVAGQILVDPADPSRLVIQGFQFRQPTAINDSFVVIQERQRSEPDLPIKLGNTEIFWQENIKELRQTEDGKLVGWSDSNAARTVKILATIKISSLHQTNVDSSVAFDPVKKLFSFKKSFTNSLPSFSQKLEDLFAPENLDINGYRSPFGSLGNGINFQFKNTQMSKEALNLPIRLEIDSSHIKQKKVLRVENLMAGPVGLFDFNQKKMKESLKKAEPVEIELKLSLDDAMLGLAEKRGILPQILIYDLIYFPDLGDVYVENFEVKEVSKRSKKNKSQRRKDRK